MPARKTLVQLLALDTDLKAGMHSVTDRRGKTGGQTTELHHSRSCCVAVRSAKKTSLGIILSCRKKMAIVCELLWYLAFLLVVLILAGIGLLHKLGVFYRLSHKVVRHLKLQTMIVIVVLRLTEVLKSERVLVSVIVSTDPY